jgi:histidine ammonia-lyase
MPVAGAEVAGSERTVLIDGTRLTCQQVRWVARDNAAVRLAAAGIERASAAADAVRQLGALVPVYGRTTGVGANREVSVSDQVGHGRRLLRSHAGGAGPPIDVPEARAMMVVRLNQLAAGGSGVKPAALEALAQALNDGLVPPVRQFGAIGTGDLHALASTALCLLGELPWHGGTTPPGVLDPGDALAFISSSAATLGEAALAREDVHDLLDASLVVAALSTLAVDGDAGAYDALVQQARPHPGQLAAAARLRDLLSGQPARPARLQDPYSYRALPQVHGPALDAAAQLERVLAVDMNASCENPLVDVAGGRVLHNGNFHTAYVTLALDSMSLALYQTAALSAARLSSLMDPVFTGLTPFLADRTQGSSGVMALEYVAQSCLAELRRCTIPSALATAVISRGAEDHASFSSEAARSLSQGMGAYRVVLSCELVAAVRAARMRGLVPSGTLGGVYRRSLAVLDQRTEDRPLDGDLRAAEKLLPSLAVGRLS